MKKVTAEVIEKNRFLVTVEVEDDATESAIYDAIVDAYVEDDYEVVEQLKRREVSTADRVYIAFKLKQITLDKQYERMMKKWKSK